MKAMTNNFSDSNELSNQIKTSKKKNKSYKKGKVDSDSLIITKS